MPVRKPAVSKKNASLATRNDYSEVLAKILDEGLCPFCEQNLFKHHRKPLLFKTKHWLITENAWPYPGTKLHLLLIARSHIESADALSGAAWTDLGTAFKRICADKGISGASLLMRSGDMLRTGASVAHLHAQVLMGGKHVKGATPITAVVGFKK